MNEEDEEFLPASHPLNAYLKSIDLDEDVEQSSFQTQAFDISKDPISPSKPQQLGLLQYFYMKVRKMKAAMIKMIATSDILVEDDTYIVHHYLSALDTPGDGRKTHLPSPFLLVSVGFAFVLASLHFMSLLFCLFAPLFIVLPFFASHFLLRDILARISYFHASFRKSILFLQGIACSERGLTFIAIRTGQGRISTTCFPQFMAQLHQNLAGYIVTASEVSVTAHNACRLYSLLELGGHLSDLSPDVLAAISEPSLRSVRGLHEFLLFLDSEVLQRMAWLLSSESGFSVRSGWRLLCLLSLWNWKLQISSSSIESLNDVRLRLLTGKQPSQQNHKLRGGTADADPGTAFPAMFVSHLDSLNYHLVNWCERIRVLREKALSVAPSPNPSSLWSLVSEDLQLMRYILKNCETCLNEAESVTTAKPPEENSALTETRPPSAETNRETAPIKIEAVDLPTEDEVLEAVADPDSTSPSDGDLGIYDNDIFTGRLDLKTLRQRSEYRSLLLSELNSVIAHRLNETREREKRALLKSKGVPAVASTGETKRSDETQEKKEVGQYEFAREEGEMTPDRCTPMEVLHDTLQGTDAPLLVDTESKSDSAMGAPNFPGSTADVLMKSQLDVYDRHSHDSSICDESETIGDKNGFELISGAQNLFPPPKGLLNEPTDGLRPPDHLPNLPFSPNLDQVIRHRRPLEETFDEVATGEDAYDDPTSEVSLPTNP